ncbi:LysR substrate-binding domain-containing protein [Shewanella sp. 10N.261.52.F9]|uniref:LysR substrate-binding domain-containing protein n=1 Tax=Shewanella TaxID=22 RepID=UPI00200D6F78|nr:LysR substrate-binding domain-containing protein [Shewanella marinintestina]MCL1146148.1 LysR substrate-binding domain-containing protein [Shewanella marinintestina]
MRITLKQLTIFKAIHHSGQISKAAKDLHMSVPAVSMALKDLEGSLGSRLFDRNSNGLVINDNGKVILPYANEMLSKGMQLEQMFSEQSNGIRGSLKVGSSKTAGNYVLSRKIPLFKKEFPSVDIKLVVGNSITIEQMVSEKELDLGFIDAKPGSQNLNSTKWLKDKICIVTARTNPIAAEPISAERLSQELWVLDETNSISRIRAVQLLKSAKVNIEQELTMTTMGAIKRAIGTGIGVSVLPWLAVVEEVERGELIELDLPCWDHQRQYWAITRENEALGELASKFLAFCNTDC